MAVSGVGGGQTVNDKGERSGRSGRSLMQYCGFKIGSNTYGVPVVEVQEIVKPQSITPVPLSPVQIRGLINLRGQIVTTIDLKRLFKIDKGIKKEHMNIIVRDRDSLASLMVDEIQDVIEAEEVNLGETPDTLNPSLKPFVKGVYKLEGTLLIILDLKKVLHA